MSQEYKCTSLLPDGLTADVIEFTTEPLRVINRWYHLARPVL